MTEAEGHALRVVSCNADWTAERRWLAGLRGSGSCDFCLEANWTPRHEFHDCAAMATDIASQRWAGRLRRTRSDSRPELAPLTEAALPSKLWGWQPVEVEFAEGWLTQGYEGESYGDGSGYCQQERGKNIATWSIVRTAGDVDDGWVVTERLRGNITGWFPTVPRAEMRALIEHLRHTGQRGTYVGDCKSVIDAALYGVPEKWLSWKNINADLWK